MGEHTEVPLTQWMCFWHLADEERTGGRLLCFLLIRLVLLITCVDLICFGLHIVISYVPFDDDNYYDVF